MQETFSPDDLRVIPKFPCHDCGFNTVPLNGFREYYEVWDELWHTAEAPGIGQSDNGVEGFYLCVGCLEKRIKRKLQANDFKPFPANRISPWLSPRLNDRLGGQPLAPKHKVIQFYPNALDEHVAVFYKPLIHYKTPTGAYALGGNCEW